ncbi:hypothetical protein TNCV_4787081 [Trichonephila clavipes]|nr:hypothetical protein TNCV_4787081 [Trichonephila clavipes]
MESAFVSFYVCVLNQTSPTAFESFPEIHTKECTTEEVSPRTNDGELFKNSTPVWSLRSFIAFTGGKESGQMFMIPSLSSSSSSGEKGRNNTSKSEASPSFCCFFTSKFHLSLAAFQGPKRKEIEREGKTGI